jgi:hypothetical protein
MKLKNTDKLEIVDRKIKVNGQKFIVQYHDEPLYYTESWKLLFPRPAVIHVINVNLKKSKDISLSRKHT